MDYREKFNALSPEIRKIGAMAEAQTRIQMLNKEKARLRKRYTQSVKEINEYICNCEDSIKRLEMDLK